VLEIFAFLTSFLDIVKLNIMKNYRDTICAIATPPGRGSVAMIRVSGEGAIVIVDKIYTPITKHTTFRAQASYTITYGTIYKKNKILDKVIASVFRSPNSFTGEDIVEITCHGSVYIQEEIIKLLIDNGCFLAQPGEFTKRAFLNGKIDLTQAEAIADLISSSSDTSHSLAFNQMRGEFSKKLKNLRSQLLQFSSLIELELDFGEENTEFVNQTNLLSLVSSIENTLLRLIKSFDLGNAVKNGIPVAIVGETNVGKSTLLNYLLNEERSIVSEIRGTTRNSIEEVININGTIFRFIDTAGIRNTKNKVEVLSINRTYQIIDKAFLVIWMVDVTSFSKRCKLITDRIISLTSGKKLIIIFNKIDKLNSDVRSSLKEKFLLKMPFVDHIYLSAKCGKNIDILIETLLKVVNFVNVDRGDVTITNLRHYKALKLALKSIHRIKNGLKTNIFSEFISQDICECTSYLGEISGEITSDEILKNIFKNFCIGK
jgi:tRNA modification GTPase